MKKAFSLLAVFMVAVMWSATGFSAEKYVSGNIGISWPNDVKVSDEESAPEYVTENEFDSGITLIGAYGTDFGDVRLETELGYQQNDLQRTLEFEDGSLEDEYEMNGDMSIISILGNAYYDIAISEKVEFYLTAGAGVAFVSFGDIGEADDDAEDLHNVEATAFAYQLGAGLAMPVADNITLDARYRYFATADFTLDDTTIWWDDTHVTDLATHSVLLGLRVTL